MATTSTANRHQLKSDIQVWAKELGFQQVGIATIELSEDSDHLRHWIANGRHGNMDYMSKHGSKRDHPAELIPDTLSIISARMDYLPRQAANAQGQLNNSQQAYVSRYALGRDYHKILRNRLKELAQRIESQVQRFGFRVFVDSAPVLERAIARNAGLGWIGKNTNIINKDHGSWFFLGEIYTNLALPADRVSRNHCGSCTACMDICPTRAFVGPYQLDARRCISYLTIENHGPIPVGLRKAMGNRIYGCDDCQLVCPWNKFAKVSPLEDFDVRYGLDSATLVDLFAWTEADFDQRTLGSAIRRIGYTAWLRNIAVALGNAESTTEVIDALTSRQYHASALVREHVNWALEQHTNRLSAE